MSVSMIRSSSRGRAGAALQPAAQHPHHHQPGLGRGLLRHPVLLRRRLSLRPAKAFRAVGQDLVLMFGGQTSTQAGGERAGRRIRLELTDVDAIREAVPMVAAISPEVMMGGMTVVRGYRTQNHDGARGASGLRADPQHDHVHGPLAQPEDEIAEAARGRAGRARPRRSSSARSRRRARRSPSTGCASRWSACCKTKTQISNYNTPDNECVFIPYETASLFRDLQVPRRHGVDARQSGLPRGGRAAGARRRWRACTTSRPTTSAPCGCSCSTNSCGWWTPWGSRCGCCWASSAR